ncbi:MULTISPECIES: flagellar filament capping protein FliD [unclassified Oscillibacter]|uniref:flagellar filament capping protein FliD n=1 Tax=unclassified Oscillibacter TaxID=2629304 RepID=UPI0025E18459|nr:MULTISPECIES: flagellar filament capping protein FliD [unclassified Oscillibacter]
MASVSGVTSSNSSSIYGNRNVLSGLATGMDTESMIENAVSGYNLKISSLQQKQTKLTWQQEAIREISSPMIKFAQKYTSYNSSTNLLSPSYFNKSVITSTNGANASKVSASGKTSSDVQISGVKQLASKSTYSASAADLFSNLGITGKDGIATIIGSDLDLSQQMDLSKVSGTLTLSYGSSRSIDLSFGDLETYSSADDFVRAINVKLASTTVTDSTGESVPALTMVKASLGDDGKVNFVDNQGAGNTVTVTGATGKLKETLNIDTSKKESFLTIPSTDGDLIDLVDKSGTTGKYLSGKTISMSVDGKTKTITLPTYNPDELDLTTATTAEKEQLTKDFVTGLQSAVKDAFGTNVKVELNGDKLQFTGQKGSTITISATSDVGKTLGLSGSFTSSYLDTGKTLGSLLELKSATDSDPETLGGIEGTVLRSDLDKITKKSDGTYVDSDGNKTDENGYRLGSDGKQLYGYELEISGKKLTFTRDSALDSVISAINSESVGLSASFSKTTNQIQLASRETGAASQIIINENITDENGSTKTNLGALLFGSVGVDAQGKPVTSLTDASYTAGQDAVFSMEVNGVDMGSITRSDNTFSVDGLSVTLKGAFGTYSADTVDADGNTVLGSLLDSPEAVTFTSVSDTDTLVDTITGMVDELNEILKSVRDAHSTLPNYKSDKSRYDPLTDDDKSGMTDSAIEKYEEKAKQGILFGDSDLTSFYSKLLSAISPSGAAGSTLSAMGISTTYSDGVTTLQVDEDALRDALSTDPDSVRDAFTSTTGSGGLMVNVSKIISDYSSTTGATKGILVQKAGSVYSPLSILSNTLQDQIDEYDDQITRWQDKLSDQVDYYTRMFTRLETLTSSMNSQSSMISSMLGG